MPYHYTVDGGHSENFPYRVGRWSGPKANRRFEPMAMFKRRADAIAYGKLRQPKKRGH